MHWGDVPEWVGAILTSGSVFAAYITLRRAQRQAEMRQAVQIHVVEDMHDPEQAQRGCKGTVTIHNRSTAPIYVAQLGIACMKGKFRRPLPKLLHHGDRDQCPFLPNLRPGCKVSISVPCVLPEGQFYVALFRDANGLQWIRTSSGATVRTDWRNVSRADEHVGVGSLIPVKDE